MQATSTVSVSAMSDSDVGDQYMLFMFLADFQYVVDIQLLPTSE